MRLPSELLTLTAFELSTENLLLFALISTSSLEAAAYVAAQKLGNATKISFKNLVQLFSIIRVGRNSLDNLHLQDLREDDIPKLEKVYFESYFYISRAALLSYYPSHTSAQPPPPIESSDGIMSNHRLRKIADSYPNITHVEIRKNLTVNHKGLKALVRGCRQISHVILSDCPKIDSHKGFPQLCKLPLIHLDLSNNPRVSNTFIFSLVKNVPTLVHINLANCKKISNEAVGDLAKLRSLVVLNVSGNPVSDQGIRAIRDQRTPLESLDISNCRNLTIQSAAVIDEIVQQGTLRTLNISGCSQPLIDDVAHRLSERDITFIS